MGGSSCPATVGPAYERWKTSKQGRRTEMRSVKRYPGKQCGGWLELECHPSRQKRKIWQAFRLFDQMCMKLYSVTQKRTSHGPGEYFTWQTFRTFFCTCEVPTCPRTQPLAITPSQPIKTCIIKNKKMSSIILIFINMVVQLPHLGHSGEYVWYSGE